jgi:TusA-related sulfurtransferase
MPVIELAKHVEDVAVGEIVALLSDDPAAAADVAAWCRMREHEYVGAEPAADGAAYLVRRLH